MSADEEQDRTTRTATDDEHDFFADEQLGHVAAPEAQITASLQAALLQLREDAEHLAELPESERADAAERIADATAQLDEQIAAASRADDD